MRSDRERPSRELYDRHTALIRRNWLLPAPSPPLGNAFVLPRLEPVQRGRGPPRERPRRGAWIFSREPLQPSERDRFRSVSAILSPSRWNYHVFGAIPWREVASSETVTPALVSTPPVWCFQPNAGSCTLSVVNLRTVRRLNRNANLYAAADLRAARSVLAGGEGCSIELWMLLFGFTLLEF